MADELSFPDVVDNAISSYLSSQGTPGMASSFILAVAIMNVDGTQSLRLVTPTDQGPHVSAGLASFADEYVRDDIRAMFADMYWAGSGDDDE